LRERHTYYRTRSTRLLLWSVLAVPVSALLGFAEWVWPILALPLAFHLAASGRIYAPRPFFLWLGFTVLAVFSVLSAGDGYVALGTFGAATVVFLYAFNLSQEELPDHVIIWIVALFWVAVALSGLLGVLTGTTEFPSLAAEIVNPAPETDLDILTQVRFADGLKGGEPSLTGGFFPHRPSGIFPYANHWGSAVIMFLGAAIVLRIQSQGGRNARWWDFLFVITLVPFVLSRNRWAWASFPIIVLYFAARFWRPNRTVARLLLGGLVLLAVVTVTTPLRGVITDRSMDDAGARPEQYELSIDLVADAPLLGYGTIQVGENEDGGKRQLGADSQILYSLVSYGIPATALLFTWFLVATISGRRVDTPILFVAHFALVVFIIQSPFYVYLPHRLVLTMALTGAMYRQLHGYGSIRRPPLLLLATRPSRRTRSARP
jgi:hypothetical protein